jgi:hypothetical protein
MANPLAANTASLEAGEQTYINACLKCHRVEGRGPRPSTTNPPDFQSDFVRELSDGELF